MAPTPAEFDRRRHRCDPGRRRHHRIPAALAVQDLAAIHQRSVLDRPAGHDHNHPDGPPPVTEASLNGLLLTPAEINTAMRATGMTVFQPWNTLMDVGTNPATPPECLPIDGAAEDGAYTGSGWTAVRGQTLRDPHPYKHVVDQAVVLFPTAQAAAAFANASPQSWSACANRRYTSSGGQVSMGCGPCVHRQRQHTHRHHYGHRRWQRLGVSAGTDGPQQRSDRRLGMQLQHVRSGGQRRRPDRRQSAYLGPSSTVVIGHRPDQRQTAAVTTRRRLMQLVEQ